MKIEIEDMSSIIRGNNDAKDIPRRKDKEKDK